MEWKQIRAHYERLFLEQKRRQGATQKSVAKRGGLAKRGELEQDGDPYQSAISKLLSNDNLGPSVEVFARAVEGLGMSLSDFFAQIEHRAAPTPSAVPFRATNDGGGQGERAAGHYLRQALHALNASEPPAPLPNQKPHRRPRRRG